MRHASLWTSALFAAGSLWVTAGQAADVKAAAAPAARVTGRCSRPIRSSGSWMTPWTGIGPWAHSSKAPAEPSDLLILYANRQTADKVMALAFDIARANAELLSSEAGAAQRAPVDHRRRRSASSRTNWTPSAAPSPGRWRSYEQRPAGSTKALKDRLAELRGELAMVDARRNLLQTMSEFVNQSDPKSAGANALKAQIDAIAATIPTAGANPAATVAAAVPAAARAAGSGAVGTRLERAQAARQSRGHRLDRPAYGGSCADVQGDRRGAREPAEVLWIPQRRWPPRRSTRAARCSRDCVNSSTRWHGCTSRPPRSLIPLAKEQILLRQYRHTLAQLAGCHRKAVRGRSRPAWRAGRRSCSASSWWCS